MAMAATQSSEDELNQLGPPDITSIRLLEAISRDPKPSFVVQAHHRPPYSSNPILWFNNAAECLLRLTRRTSSSWSPTATSPTDIDDDETPFEVQSDISTIAQYDHEFNGWILNRLAYAGENHHGDDVSYYTCSKGITLSWKLPVEVDQRKAERSMSQTSNRTSQTVYEDFKNMIDDIKTSSEHASGPNESNKKRYSEGSRTRKSSTWSATLPDGPMRNSVPSRKGNLQDKIIIDMDKRFTSEPESVGLSSEFYKQNLGVIDWTRCASSDLLPEHHRIIRDHDWGSTSAGPIENWPQYLRTTVVTICAMCFPCCLYYGPDFILIYNDPFKEMMAGLHPWGLGRPCHEVWGSVYEDLLDRKFTNVMRGIPTYQEDHEVFLVQGGITEQAYFSWSLSPIADESGKPVGVFSIFADLTARVLAARSFQLFGEIGTKISGVTNTKDFWNNWLEALQTNETDCPFALVYSRVVNHSDAPSDSDSDGHKTSHDYILQYEGSYNVPECHPIRPRRLHLSQSCEGLSAAFREACSHEYIHLTEESELLPTGMLGDIKSRVFGDQVSALVICPIRSHSATDEVSGFMVLGLNTRRRFNDTYQVFVQLLTQALSNSLSACFFLEAEVRRSENLARMAAMEKSILSNQLAAKTIEAKASDNLFKRMTKVVPVGIYRCDISGKVTFVNDAWYNVSQVPRDWDFKNWIAFVHPDDRDALLGIVAQLDSLPQPIQSAFRWITPYTTKDGQVIERWCLGCTQAEYAEDGSIEGFLGCATDISEQKFREATQKRRIEEMKELKRQQDNFVDIASHEMRNPLSAVLQLSDTIISSLMRCEKYYSQCDLELEEEVASSIDAAQTILLCASHQKRVVDDILTLSKLDSARLIITPVDVQPIAVVNEAMKMFEQECILNNIHMDSEVDYEYRNLEVDWVKLDPTRLLQVLINLLTNALKFIRSEAERKIIITVSASAGKPVDLEGLMVFPSIKKSNDSAQVDIDTPRSEEVPEDSLYLSFEVKDTGKGLTDEEKKLLFQKFSQASPRTHIQYGGSGLGLFISRELVQLQSGEIGVLSEAGKGCAFCFYIKVVRGEPQNTELPVYARTIVPGGGVVKRTSAGTFSPPLIPVPMSRPASPSLSNIGSSRLGRTSGTKTLEGVRVLIVEDNLVNQNVVRKQLLKLGCETYVANHGLEALEKVMQSKLYFGASDDAYDLAVILMDVEMPVMDGIKATGEIRRLQAEGSLIKHIPILAVTANARPEQIKQMKERGMDDVLSKPFRIPELVSKLENLVGKTMADITHENSLSD